MNYNTASLMHAVFLHPSSYGSIKQKTSIEERTHVLYHSHLWFCRDSDGTHEVCLIARMTFHMLTHGTEHICWNRWDSITARSVSFPANAAIDHDHQSTCNDTTSNLRTCAEILKIQNKLKSQN